MFRRHMQKRHPDQVQTEVLVQWAEKAIESEQPCPLCMEKYLPRRLQSHFGRHMEQIALFILLGASEDDSEEESPGEASESDEDDPETEFLVDGPKEESSADDPETEHGPESPAAIDTTLGDTQTSQPIDISPEAFHAAAESGDVKRIRLLLTAGADIEARGGRWDQAALSIAAEKGHVEVARLLIAEGADVNSRSRTERSPLSYAAEFGQEQMVRLLLATEGVDYNAKDNDNEVPLFRAVVHGHADVVRLFLAKEDIDVTSKLTSVPLKGLSPLIYAAKKGYAEVVKALLTKEGIDVNSESEGGGTPLLDGILGAYGSSETIAAASKNRDSPEG